MQKVGSREFKNRLGRYLRAVREGKTLVVTDRGKAVAKVSPPDPVPDSAPTMDEVLKKLEADGLIHLRRKPFGKFKPIPSRGGKLASEMIIEDRRR